MEDYEIIRYWFAGSESVKEGWMYKLINKQD
jgi:hypothetical protein